MSVQLRQNVETLIATAAGSTGGPMRARDGAGGPPARAGRPDPDARVSGFRRAERVDPEARVSGHRRAERVDPRDEGTCVVRRRVALLT